MTFVFVAEPRLDWPSVVRSGAGGSCTTSVTTALCGQSGFARRGGRQGLGQPAERPGRASRPAVRKVEASLADDPQSF